MASFGEASGDPDPMPPRRLGALCSIYLTHPSVSNYTGTRAELLASANDLFAMVLAAFSLWVAWRVSERYLEPEKPNMASNEPVGDGHRII